MSAIIKAEGLSKKYMIDHQQREAYSTLRDVLARGFRDAGRRIAGRISGANAPMPAREEFWALRDVSFDIRKGERIGIIGKNGAGKSTLLKILARITEPTKGCVTIDGRVASLLEVGTGFHPELTGRENVYLNGAILGMSRSVINRKFDAIVAFAEVERFLDTPVKRYSSGMYVRLAFSVAAHLEPEILLIDEVLAVGDGAFQRKCLGRMDEASKDGRTVLFVSHNMQAVRQLCETAIWLKNGRIAAAGPSESVVTSYLQDLSEQAPSLDFAEAIARLPRDPAFRLKDIAVLQEGRQGGGVVNGKPVEIEISYDVLEEWAGLHVYIQLLDSEGTLLFESLHNGDAEGVPVVAPGAYVSRAVIPANFLSPVRYTLRILAGINNVRGFFPEPLSAVIDVHAQGVVNRAYPGYQSPGRLMPLLEWRTVRRDL